MKLTNKLHQMDVDKSAFFESLSPGTEIQLASFFSRIGQQYSVFFSNHEQLAIRN